MFLLTTPQRNIWNLQKFYSDSCISNIAGMITFDGKLEINQLCATINLFVKNNVGIRMQFEESNGNVYQYAANYIDFEVNYISFSDYEQARKYFTAEGRKPFALYNSAMYRFCIYEISGKTGVFVCLNHLVSDAWTLSLFCTEIADYYNRLYIGTEVGTGSDYIDYINSEQAYFNSKRYAKDSEYWNNRFAECPAVSHIKPYSSESVSAKAERIIKIIDCEMTSNIKSFCSHNNISLSVLFESVIFTYLYKINEKHKETIIGTMVLNRTSRSEKQTAGMFVSTVPLGVAVSGNDTALSLCQKVTENHWETFRHQKYPFAEILKNIRTKFNFEGRLFDVAVSCQNASVNCEDLKFNTDWLHNGYSEVPFALHIDERDNNGCLTINIDYQTEVFRCGEAEYIYKRIIHILSQFIKNADLSINDVSVIPDDEYRKVIYDFNDTAVDYPRDKCVHELFSEQAAKNPDKVALIFEEQQFTYKQLDEMSNSLAHYLREKSVKPNDIVPIISKRSWHVIVAMLGILKAGGAYMPIDPNYPIDRIEYMISEADSRIALCYGFDNILSIETVDLDSIDYHSDIQPIDNINSPDDTCYVIFTSGSTGKPKGVMIKHKNVANYCNNNNNIVHKIIKKEYVSIISVTNIVFDIFVTESLLPVLNGFTVYFACEEESASQKKLSRLICKNRIDVMQTTPTKMRSYMLDKNNLKYLSKLKIVILGGESLTSDLYSDLKSCTDAEIYNIYGPSETTVWSTNKKIEDTDITIGKPIANTQIYILDNNDNPCPVGVAGELCISGDGVGKGYLNRPDLTAEKFVANPFINGKVMYRTGDLARWREDGEIEYLGRIDTQVKIRGLRIELGEIESVMSSFEGIQLCAVSDKKDKNGRQYLVGYYTSDNDIDGKLLRDHLSAKLPKYMIPNFFVHLAEMPMTVSGKTDRKNLPLPEFTDNTIEYIVPETETEKKLAAIWQDVLKYNNIGRNSDFIDCGGDSLSAITILAEIEDKFSIECDMKLILEHTVLEDLAGYIDLSEKKKTAAFSDVKRYVLLPQQKAIYLACQKASESLVYNMPLFIRLDSNAKIEQIKQNVIKSYNNHPALKTAISVQDGEIVGIIDDTASLVFETFSKRSDFVRPFDLSKAPLIRVGFGDGGAAIDIHHIVGDGESINLIIDEIFKGSEYSETVTLPAYAVNFKNILENGGFNEHKEFFRKNLCGDIEPLELPETPNGENTGKSFVYTLDSKFARTVQTFAKENGITNTCAYFSIFVILMSKFSNKRNVTTSIILTNRAHAEIVHTCGMFVNTVPVLFDVNSDYSHKEFMRAADDLLLDIYKYQELPMLEICEAAGITDKNIVNSTFVYQPGEMRLNGIDFEYIDTKAVKMDLAFQIIPQNDGSCKILIEYNGAKYGEGLMKRLVFGYTQIISALYSNKKIKDIGVISDNEYNKVVYDFNNTAVTYDKHKCVHELFYEQAKLHPDREAVVFNDKSFTYKEFDEITNSLAHYLREKGVKPNDIVPIISKRSWHTIAAMLGIMKAGGAYMPIDPNYPIDRIEYMISEADSKIALCYGFDNILSIETVDLESIDYHSDIQPIDNINSPDDTCYVIFTSGSTGKPKGALLKHSNLLNFTLNADKDFVIHNSVFGNCKRIVAVGAFVFDISIVEIFQPLLNGLCTVIADENTANNSEAMAQAIISNNIDILHTTPTRLNYYLENDNFAKAASRLKVILAAGEALPDELYRRITSCTNAILFNGYGPTETTVGCTFSKISGKDKVTIGKPIANVQIYILDRDGSPCPIDVAGEIYIAGDGVGKGYLNRPELTAEKFVENPFIKGGRMYKSGDLARWREDGEIEYLGRIDTQVKIRGLRIELGEIESAISSFNGILMSAAADKRDKNGRQYLVGYYTSNSIIDERQLRSFLTERLPQYMIPNYFMRLDEIPVNISGKTDRKNLPEPDMSASLSEYVPPRNERESILCDIAAKLLNYEKISITDDFFELGGDSLRAVEFTAEAHESGIDFDLQLIFEKRTVAELSKFLEENNRMPSVMYKADDFTKFNKTLAVSKNIVPSYQTLGNVFITGITGFLGAHILDSFMRNENGKIYCLVRSNLPDDRRGKLSQMLHYYFGNRYDNEIGRRIIPIVGDIVCENLSDNLPNDVQTVIHTAATVKHFGEYSYFEKVNVKGTENVLKYAEKINASFMQISTVSVSGLALLEKGNGVVKFNEGDLYIGQNLSNVYLRSKFEAERLVLEAKLRGMNCKIFRVGNLTNSFADMKFQPNYSENAFLRRIKTFIDIKAYPDLMSEESAEFSPVDLTADAIIKLAQNIDNGQTVFHVNNINTIEYSRMFEIFGKHGCSLNPVSLTEFENMLTSDNSAYNSVKNDLYEIRQNSDYVHISAEGRYSAEILSKTGFEWCSIDTDYITKYLDYYSKLGYWGYGDEK